MAKPKLVTVVVNNRDVTVEDRELSGSELKSAAGVPPDFQLFAEHGSKLEPVGDDERVRVHNGQRFRAVSGQDVS